MYTHCFAAAIVVLNKQVRVACLFGLHQNQEIDVPDMSACVLLLLYVHIVSLRF